MKLLNYVLGFALVSAQNQSNLVQRFNTASGGSQAVAQTSTDFLTNSEQCVDFFVPMTIEACAADVTTGGNPGPFDAYTPLNVLLRCPTSVEILCETTGDAIQNMCCQVSIATLPANCALIVRVFNGGDSTTTLVTANADLWPATPQELAAPRKRITGTPLPNPPPGQTRSFLVSVVTRDPVSVPFNNRRTVPVDTYFPFCGQNGAVTFGITGQVLSAESQAFICAPGSEANCGPNNNLGTDNKVSVFHSITTRGPLTRGIRYFVRLFGFGHQDSSPSFSVIISNTESATGLAEE